MTAGAAGSPVADGRYGRAARAGAGRSSTVSESDGQIGAVSASSSSGTRYGSGGSAGASIDVVATDGRPPTDARRAPQVGHDNLPYGTDAPHSMQSMDFVMVGPPAPGPHLGCPGQSVADDPSVRQSPDRRSVDPPNVPSRTASAMVQMAARQAQATPSRMSPTANTTTNATTETRIRRGSPPSASASPVADHAAADATADATTTSPRTTVGIQNRPRTDSG